jgi:hypothetical protein
MSYEALDFGRKELNNSNDTKIPVQDLYQRALRSEPSLSDSAKVPQEFGNTPSFYDSSQGQSESSTIKALADTSAGLLSIALSTDSNAIRSEVAQSLSGLPKALQEMNFGQILDFEKEFFKALMSDIMPQGGNDKPSQGGGGGKTGNGGDGKSGGNDHSGHPGQNNGDSKSGGNGDHNNGSSGDSKSGGDSKAGGSGDSKSGGDSKAGGSGDSKSGGDSKAGGSGDSKSGGNGGTDKVPDGPPPDAPKNKGKILYELQDNKGHFADSGMTKSIDDNKHNFGGSSVEWKNIDGKQVLNLSVDRWPNLPAGWEKNPPAGVSPAEIERMKSATSYRAEATDYSPNHRLRPGHTYDVQFTNQLVKWDSEPSAWGDMFMQLRQSANYGVPELALGTHNGKYGVFYQGGWHDLPLTVDDTKGKWQQWGLHMQMPNENGGSGDLQVMYNGKPIYDIPNWKLTHGYSQGDPYLKFGIYKAVYHEDDNGKYTATHGSRYREINYADFTVSDEGA